MDKIYKVCYRDRGSSRTSLNSDSYALVDKELYCENVKFENGVSLAEGVYNSSRFNDIIFHSNTEITLKELNLGGSKFRKLCLSDDIGNKALKKRVLKSFNKNILLDDSLRFKNNIDLNGEVFWTKTNITKVVPNFDTYEPYSSEFINGKLNKMVDDFVKSATSCVKSVSYFKNKNIDILSNVKISYTPNRISVENLFTVDISKFV